MSVGTATGTINILVDQAERNLQSLEGSLNNISRGGMSGFADAILANEAQITGWGRTLLGVGTAITSAFVAPVIMGSKAAWDQVDAVQQATVALSAYEKDTAKVNTVLQELVAYAQSDLGVLFQRQDLFAAAQGLKVMGAETENLVDYVEIMSRAVGLGTISWDYLGIILGRVGATGKLTGHDFDQLSKAGYRLDPALRNTTVTWEELFAALDKGMPADALAGQADTIQGKMIRMQSALRNLGLEFLGVDKKTSQFIEGGLGHTLVRAMEQARSGFLALAPAAGVFGNAIAVVARAASRVVDAILALPQPIITAVAVLGTLSGVAMMAAGTFLLFLPRIARTIQAFQALGGMAGVLTRLRGAVTALRTALMGLALSPPILLALAAAAAAVVAYRTNFLGFRDAIQRVVEAFRVGKAAFDQFNQAGSTLGAVFKAISAALASLDIGPLNKLADMLNVVGEAINRFWRGFGEGGGTTEATIKTNIEVSGDDKFIEWIENPDAVDGFDYMVRIRNPDGSFKEFGQVMESYTDENDPNIAHIKIKTDEGEYWTTVDKTTGEIGDGTIEIKAETKQATKSVDRFTKRLAKGMREAGEYLSESNFRPLQTLGDWLLDGADNLDQLGDAFRTARNLGLNPFMSTVRALGVTFPMLSGPMATVERTINNLTSSFRRFRDDGATPVQAALSALGDVFPALSGVTESLGEVFDNLGDTVLGLVDAFQAAITGDWAGVFTGLQSAAFNAWDAVQAGIDLVRELASGIGTLAVRIGGWAWDQAVDLYDSFMENWPSWRDTVVGIVHDIGDLAAKVGRWLLEQGQSLAGAIAEHWPRWVASAKALALDIGELAAKVGGWVVEQAQSLAGKIQELWPGWVASAKAVVLDIGELLATVGGWVITQTVSLAGKIQEMWPRWRDSARAVQNMLGDLVADITGWVITQAQSLAGKISELWPGWAASAKAVVKVIDQLTASVKDWYVSDPAKGTLEQKIFEAIGSVTIKSIPVILSAVSWSIGELNTGNLKRLIWLGIFGAIVLATLPVSVPVALTLGAIAGIATIGFLLAKAVGVWARSNPVEAVDVLIDIWMGMGDIRSKLPSRRRLLDMALGLLGLPTTAELEIDVKVVLNFIFGDNDSPDKAINENLGGSMDDVIKIGQIELDSDGFVINEKGQRLIGPDGNPLTAEDLTGMADRMASQGIRMTDAGFQLDPTRFHWENEGEIQSLMQRSFSQVGQSALTQAGAAIGAVAGSAMANVGSALGAAASGWGSVISEQATSLGAAASTAFGSVDTNAATQLSSVGLTVGAQALGWALGVSAQTVALGTAATDAFGAVGTNAGAELAKVGSVIGTQTASWASTIGSQTAAMAATSTANFTSMAASAASQASSMGTAVGSAASTMASNVGSRVSGMATDVGARMLGMRMGAALEASSMQQAASTSASTMQRNVQTSAANMAMSVGQSVSAMRQNAVTQTANMATQIIAAMQMMGSGVRNAVSSAFGAIAGIIASSGGTAINAAYMVGVAIGQGLANGINSMVGAVASATANLVNAAAGAAAAAALIRSPSRLFMWQGEDIGEGMAIGIDNKQDRIERSARDLVESASAQALRTSIAINGLTGGSPFVGTVPLVARGASRSYTDYRSVNFEAGSIVQQAGESVEDLADRVVAKVFSGFDDSGGIWEQR